MDKDRDAVERLEDRLYSRTAETGLRPRQQGKSEEMAKPHGWSAEPPTPATLAEPFATAPRSKRSLLLPIFLAALLFFISAVGYAVYSFLYGGNVVSSSNISLNMLGPSMVDGGKEASFDIIIENKNASDLELVDLVVEYPDGTRSSEDVKVSLARERISLGTIESGSRSKQTVHPVIFGEEGSTKRITVSIEYRVAGSNAIFTKDGGLDVLIGASPIGISIEGPDEAVSGQPVQFTARIRSNAQATIKDLAFEAQYPFGFQVTGVSPETSAGDSLWRLGDLNPGEEKVVTIQGVLEGQDNDERVFRFLGGSENDVTEAHIKVPYLMLPHSVSLQRPFITSSLSINRESGKTVNVKPGDPVKGVISWKNNLSTEVKDLQISAVLSGPALDKSSVIAQLGFYRSVDSTIVWNKDDDPTFGTVAPGASGEVEFTFTPIGTSGSSAVTNPEILISVSVGAKRTGTSGDSVPDEVNAAYSRIVRVGSALTAKADVRHFTGAQQNSGPMPPKVDQETTYSVVWTIQNPSNTISNGKASATLPSYVRYIGNVSPATERVEYDQKSNTVTWSLGDIKAGTGFSSAARTAAFQIGFTPSITQAGTVPELTGRLSVSGDDRFTGTRVTGDSPAVSTRFFTGEAGYLPGMDTVAPK